MRSSLARFYNCREEYLLPTAGAGEAINLAIIALKPRRIYVVEPSYGEYEDISNVLGIEYIPVPYKKYSNRFYLDFSDLDNACRDEEGLIAITNPSNPLGLYISRSSLISKMASCSAKVMIDEAYAELCSSCNIEIGKNVPRNIIIVRSLTKWLSLPGLRLGLLYIEDQEALKRVDAVRQPWNVNSLAECLGIAVAEYEQELKNFINESRLYIDNERKRLAKELEELGFQVYESSTNFLLVETLDGEYIARSLRDMGIAVRSCASFKGLGPNYIRIAIRKASENDELIKALRKVMKVG